MVKHSLILMLLAVTAVIAVDQEKRTAVVYLRNANGSVEGTVTFVQVGSGPVQITGSVNGLTDGQHGFHIHEKGDVSTCDAAGGHYNPHKKQHGGPTASERHVGDLGNINSSANHSAINIEDRIISLIGEFSIVGRSLVIHSQVDDLGLGTHESSKTTGNAGSRVVCGVIGIKDPVDKWRSASASTTVSALSVGVVSIIAAILSVF